MRLPAEILDLIFRVSHQETLIACTKDPVLFPIVERHLSHITVHFKFDMFEQDVALSNLISDNPGILGLVRTLEIQIEGNSEYVLEGSSFIDTLHRPFPVLECIILNRRGLDWYLPATFDAALENCLSLPTVQELYLESYHSIPVPLSFLDVSKNLKKLTLLDVTDGEGRFWRPNISTFPQLHSLRLLTPYIGAQLLDWVKLHINELQSLRSTMPDWEVLPELFGPCSETLRELDVSLDYSFYCSEHIYQTGQVTTTPLPELSPIPPNLQKLTIRTAVCLSYHATHTTPRACSSWLPAAAEMIKLFVPSLRHVILDVELRVSGIYPSSDFDFTKVDFSPLAMLGMVSRSIARIDLYVHSGVLPEAHTRGRLLGFLEGYEGIVRSLKEGVLVIHSERSAPGEG